MITGEHHWSSSLGVRHKCCNRVAVLGYYDCGVVAMSVYFTSDLHIHHRLVAATRYEVDGEPIWRNGEPIPEWFDEEYVVEHDRILAHNWDHTVQKDDLVYVLGDISGGTDKSYRYALQWIKERPGRKILIHGNHDPIHGMHRDASKWEDPTREAFEAHHAYLRRRVPLFPEGHQDVLLCHFPYVDVGNGVGQAGRYREFRLHDMGIPVVHGHTHSQERVSIAPWSGALQLHVGVDAWEGHLCPLEWIVSEVRSWVGITRPVEAENSPQSRIYMKRGPMGEPIPVLLQPDVEYPMRGE